MLYAVVNEVVVDLVVLKVVVVEVEVLYSVIRVLIVFLTNVLNVVV